MKAFVQFMASTAGRALRVVAGLGLIAFGLLGMEDSSGYITAAVGVVPLLTGLLDICVFGPLFGCPLSGNKVRSEA